MIRTAVVRGARDRAQLEAYLPDNYHVGQGFMAPAYEGSSREVLTFEIQGEDVAGWTLDDYVLPRLASGLIFGEEVQS